MKISETVEKFMLFGLDDMRQSIDSLDSALFYMLVERIHLVIQMSICKIKKDLPLEMSAKRQQELEKVIAQATTEHVDAVFFQRFFQKIYEYSLGVMEYIAEHQEEIFNRFDDLSVREIDDYRHLLQALDRSTCYTLMYRFDVVYQVGVFKKRENLPPMAPERWQQLVTHKRALAEEYRIDPDFIESLFDVIHQQSLQIERQIIA